VSKKQHTRPDADKRRREIKLSHAVYEILIKQAPSQKGQQDTGCNCRKIENSGFVPKKIEWTTPGEREQSPNPSEGFFDEVSRHTIERGLLWFMAGGLLAKCLSVLYFTTGN